MRVLLACVNSTVSLIGFDLASGKPFWYCPGNILRVCGACWHDNALYIASDGMYSRIDASGIISYALPGPHDNLAHSIKSIGENMVGVADTGNSRILLLADGQFSIPLSPLEGWGDNIPPDAIHLNDFLSWGDGVLASAFNYQPFTKWNTGKTSWKEIGMGCIFLMERMEHKTVSRIVASGLHCPHSLALWDDDLYCCSSANGTFLRLSLSAFNQFVVKESWHITDSHFLRGSLRLPNGWLLGGSSQRHLSDGGGIQLYHLQDSGTVSTFSVAGPGEIYDIIPWDDALMPAICDQLLSQPVLSELEGVFPERCMLPKEYR